MVSIASTDLGPDEAAGLLHNDLGQASDLIRAGQIEKALDLYVSALGLALQLGPAATQEALASSLDGAWQLASRGDAGSLCAMGPALVHLVSQVRDSGVLECTWVGQAWATVAGDVGSLIGQLGLALSLPPGSRDGMMENTGVRAAMLDEATGNAFRLVPWLETIQAELEDPPVASSRSLPVT